MTAPAPDRARPEPSPRRRLFLAFSAAVGLLASAWLVIYAVDELGDVGPGAGSDAPAILPEGAPVYAGTGRVFVLFLDSLRPDVADGVLRDGNGKQLMPRLTSLRSRGVHGVVDTVYDAVTVPAMRAALTGREHFKVLGFVQNFLRRKQNVPSVLGQLRDRGGRAALYSDMKTFLAYGDGGGIEHLSFEGGGAGDFESGKVASDWTARQVAQARAALARYREGRDDLVLFHAGFLDYAGHKYGVHHPEYAAQHEIADALVAEIDAVVPPEDTLFVFGDHGHTDTGRHALGLDVPTWIFARGPGFRQGVDLGRFRITSYRYLLSWALKLPLDPEFGATRLPAALAPATALPSGWAASAGETGDGPAAPRSLWLWLGLGVFAGALGGVWWAVLRRTEKREPKWLATILLGSALGGTAFAWGATLARLRFHVHEPFYPTMHRWWAIALVGLAALAPRLGIGATGWLALGVPFLLLWPTAYRYGAPGAFAPAWMIWAVVVALTVYARPWRGRTVLPRDPSMDAAWAWGRLKLPVAGVMVALLCWILQAYFLPDASNFEFTQFVALVPELTPHDAVLRAVAGAVLAYVVVARPRLGWWNHGFSTLFALYVVATYLKVVPADGMAHLGVAAACVAVAVHLQRSARETRRQAVPGLVVAAIVIASFWLTRNGPGARLDAVAILAAVRLSVRLMRELPAARRSTMANGALIAALGMIGVGWTTFGWGLTQLEWHAAYDLFAPRLVEDHVAWFVPFIVARYALPAVAVRILVTEGLRELGRPWPLVTMQRIAGAKIVAAIAVMAGLAWFEPASSVYLEAVSQLTVLMVLSLALL